MSQFEKCIESYRQASRLRPTDETAIQDIERNVMGALPKIRPRTVSLKGWRMTVPLAAAAVLLLVLIPRPEQQANMAAEMARVESVFYLEDHVAIWLNTDTSEEPSPEEGE
jgi:hypothetical protein